MLVPLLRLLTAGAALLAADAQPTVSFPGGASITGSLEVKPAGNPVRVFRGIPYAEPPIGDKRWKPSTLKPVTGSRLATTYGSTCIGTDTAPDATEDCLFLNVFAPANATATSKLPVMVWVHGGALLNGASNGFESQSLVKAGDQRVVVVTINYRLGVFGFFSSKELLAEGNGANFGLRDQEVAFQWIQKYIAYFGGDADNITAFGGSAGAWSLSTLMLARDGNQKLFHRAILMSGAFATVHDTPPPNVQQAKATTIATRVGCNGAANVVACLRKVDPKTLSALRDPSWRGFTWMPTVDGTFLLDTPIRRIRAGKISRIPTIVGTATDEGWYFTSWVTQESQFDSFLRAQFSMLTDAEYAKIVALYPASSFATLRHRTGEIYGDAMFVCPTEDFQLSLAARGPSYRYRFNFPANVNGYMLTLHGSDGRYLFNQPGDIADSDVPAKQVAAHFQQFWTTFARANSPNRAAGQSQKATTWPLFTTDAKQEIVLQPTLATETMGTYRARHAERCAFWRQVEERIANDVQFAWK